MSLGLGRVERWIAEDIEADKKAPHGPRPVLVSSWSLAFNYQDYRNYQSGWTPSRAQRKAVVRAMHSFVRKHPQYALTAWRGRKGLFLYEPADPVSAMWARLSLECRQFVPLSEVKAHMHEQEARQ